MKQLILSVIFLLSVFSLKVQAENRFPISRVSPEGGVSYNSIICIAEDELGYIWFGSNDGVFRYDSKNIKRYSHLRSDSTSLPTNRINGIYSDYSGNLWISTENGLCKYNFKNDNFSTFVFKDRFDQPGGSNINSFFQTSDSTFWIVDERGIGSLDIENNRIFYKNINNKTSEISIASPDSNGNVWVFFADGEIYFLPKFSNTFQYFSKGYENRVRSVLIEPNQIWIAYDDLGLLCMNNNGSTRSHYKMTAEAKYKLPSNKVRNLLKDNNGQIWAATYDGIAIIEKFEVKHIINKEKYSQLPNHSIWSLFKDSQNNTWIGTYLGGLCFNSIYNNPFTHYTHTSPVNSLSFNVVSSFAQIPGTLNLLVGTDGGGLNYFEPEKHKFSTIPIIDNGKSVKIIKSICFDKFGTLWVGTYGHGVFYRENPTSAFKKFNIPFPSGIQALDILATDNGIWVSNYPLGVYFYNFTTKDFKNYQHNSFDITTISDNNVRKIIRDKEENIWFATDNGLNLLKKDSEEFIHFFYEKNISKSISGNLIYSIFEDNKGYLWVGTNGEGLNRFHFKTDQSEHFTIKDGLSGNEILSIQQDLKDNIWLTTQKGICMLYPDKKTVRSFNHANGIYNNKFNPNASIRLSNGELYFGGTNGFVRIYTSMLNLNPNAPKTILTKLYINNKEILCDSDKSLLKDIIGKTDSLVLTHKQNNISFHFVSNNYINSEKNLFKYRLFGFSNDWIITDRVGIANFTNVPPGKYIFEIMAANNDGVWNDTPKKVSIRITPPIWDRWYAYILYFAIVVLTGAFILKQISDRQKLKNEIKLSKVREESEKQVHQMKLQFFTNISHEFRTPLTLIRGPIDRLLKEKNIDDGIRHQHTLIKKNTERLLRLVNEILDFRKLNSGKSKLNPVNKDIIEFSRNIFSHFEEHAESRSIKYSFISDISEFKMEFDIQKMDKILFNIISNAFKFSSEGSSITVEIKNNVKTEYTDYDCSTQLGENIEDDFIEINISDTGKGISKTDLPNIFSRFFQSVSGEQMGTGIGLALTKEHVLLHNGQLVVKTRENYGTVFQIYIPIKPSVFEKETTTEDNTTDLPYADLSLEQLNNQYSTKKQDIIVKNRDALILITEDNIDLLDYLGDLLQNHFRIAKARNGTEGYDQALSLYPDLIISDIMMPEMTGIELCEKIKEDIKISHIPIILLTALDTIQDRIKGIQTGADAYIAKPFNEQMLIAQIDSLLESRKQLREAFSRQENTWELKYNNMDLDKKLLQKALQIVENNINDENFTVETLAENLRLSRSHLHRKLKALTNQTSTEFIRSIRLKKAIDLMQAGELNINEICHSVGFNSASYFSKSFRKQYNMSPQDYMKNRPV